MPKKKRFNLFSFNTRNVLFFLTAVFLGKIAEGGTQKRR